jgi:serine/threonine-protein kinase
MYEDWSPVEEAETRAGGQGKVRKVRRSADGRVGALKELHPNLLRDTERRQRMAREVLALQQVQGEGIPTILDHNMDSANETGMPLYFVSEWIDGPTLHQYVGARPCSLDEALKITRDLATIVSRCHGVNVYHRDIKPDNESAGATCPYAAVG